MKDYKAVRSSLSLNGSIAFYLETSALAVSYRGNHAGLVRAMYLYCNSKNIPLEQSEM